MKKSRQNIIFAVAFSLAIHVALGAILFYNLSNNFSFSKSFNKLNLVWVALETNKFTGIVATDVRPVADSARNNTAQRLMTKDFPQIPQGSRAVVEAYPATPNFVVAPLITVMVPESTDVAIPVTTACMTALPVA